MRAWLAVALLATTTPALAVPKGADAKAAFDQGVAAYQKRDYEGASTALGKSFGLEPDVETLFAWAQAERQQDHCDKASELYRKILKFDLPDENKQVVRTKLDECKVIIAAQKPKPPVEPVPEPEPEPQPEPKPLPVDAPAERPFEGRAWWKNPVGGGLVIVGVVSLGVGGYFLMSGSKADADTANAPDYAEFERLSNRAESQGRIGVIASASGGALLLTGIIWYATHRAKHEQTTISGWLDPSGGGLAASGRF